MVVKEYVPVTICAARSRDGSVIPRQGREVLFKTTRMDFVDLYRSLVALGRNDGLVQVLDLIEENNTAYAAVSYTHLDVYKRQGADRTGERVAGGQVLGVHAH